MPRRVRSLTRRPTLGDLDLTAERIDYLFNGEPFVPSDPVPFRDREHAKRCWRKHREQLTTWWREGLPKAWALPVCMNHTPEPRPGRPWAAKQFD